MKINDLRISCKVCGVTFHSPALVGWNYEGKETYDTSVQVTRSMEEWHDKHMRNEHGLMSVLKHEYELSQAIIKATRDGERRGRLEIREEMKNATLEAMREIGRSL